MKILIACEFSGIVRDAFIARGHDVISCDLLPTEKPGPHYQGDVRDILYEKWDLIIAHPPCTYLSTVGNRWLNVAKYGAERVYTRYILRVLAIDFFMLFADHPCPKIAIENPLGIISTVYKKPNQYFCFSDHGAPFTKRTALWLKGLPPLMATKKMHIEPYRNRNGSIACKLIDQTISMPKGEKQKERSRFFPGIAAAMAAQWG